jgi:hypothetical protein
MQRYVGTFLFVPLLLLETATGEKFDYGGYIAPVVTVVLAAFTVFSQVRQKRIEAELIKTKNEHEAAKDVLEGWKKLTEAQGQTIQNHSLEFRDLRSRLRTSEAHVRLCDKSHYKLVIQLLKQGVDIDIDKIFDDLHVFEDARLRSDIQENAQSTLDESEAPNHA